MIGMVSEEAGKVEEFKREVRAWLMANLPEGWGTPEYVAPETTTKEFHELGKSWLSRLYDAGYTAFNYPKEYGGVERPQWQIHIINQEMARTGTPPKPMSNIMVAGPTLLQSGTEEQKKRYLPPMLRGDESWMQGFSEPNAGSDLANIQTVAVRDGDEWVVNGQKVWNSEWQFADYAVLIVKTDTEAPRHRNLSYFILDCKSPGFEMKPLREITGREWFSEMFFDNVRIPHENMLGEVNMGWYAAMRTLVTERNGSGQLANVDVAPSAGVNSIGGMGEIVEMAKKTMRRGKSLWEDDTYRQRIAQFAIESTAMGHSGSRTAVKVSKGIDIGHEVNIGKHFGAEMRIREADLILELLGTGGQLMRGPHSIDKGEYATNMLWVRCGTIAAGTSEINRNIIAERILGLPR